jgi:hypothetical protein
MAFIKAHTFNSEQEANEAIDLINQGEGIPVSKDAVTRTYCEAIAHEDIYYIHADDVTEKYLGASVEIEIIREEI